MNPEDKIDDLLEKISRHEAWQSRMEALFQVALQDIGENKRISEGINGRLGKISESLIETREYLLKTINASDAKNSEKLSEIKGKLDIIPSWWKNTLQIIFIIVAICGGILTIIRYGGIPK